MDIHFFKVLSKKRPVSGRFLYSENMYWKFCAGLSSFSFFVFGKYGLIVPAALLVSRLVFAKTEEWFGSDAAYAMQAAFLVSFLFLCIFSFRRLI